MIQIIFEKDTPHNTVYKDELTNESIENAKTLLIPATQYLASILDCQKNNSDKSVIEKLEEQFKKCFTFALEHKTLLYS